MRLIIIIVALVIAALVAVGVSGVLTDKKESDNKQVVVPRPDPTPQRLPETNIYVARRDIPIGTRVGPEDYDIKPWPAHILPPSHIGASQDEAPALDGQITSAPIVENEPLSWSKLRNPNDPSFLAGQLGEGMRAVTINVNMADSVAGFVAPGDLVDVIFTFDLEVGALETGDLTSTSDAGENEEVTISEILLANTKVLAVDRRVVAGPGPDGEVAPIPSSVTLAVNQRDAQKLRLGEKIGRLSLILRSIEDDEDFDKVRPSAEQDLTRLLPPAYFPALFDSDAAYDYSVIDIYGSNVTEQEAGDDADLTGAPAKQTESPFMNVNIYRGSQLEPVEVKRK